MGIHLLRNSEQESAIFISADTMHFLACELTSKSARYASVYLVIIFATLLLV